MRFLGRLLALMAGTLAFVLALAALGGAAAANGGRFSAWLDVLAHFTLIWLGLAVIAALLSLAMPRHWFRATTQWIAVLAIAGSLWLMAPDLWAVGRPKPAPPKDATVLKLIQFNSWSGRNRDFQRSIDWLYAQDADIIVLEEVKPPLREALKRRGGYHQTCERHTRCEVLILSKEKPVESGLPQVNEGYWLPAARASFEAPGGGFTVVGAHYTWPIPPGLQQAQGDRLAAVIGRFPSDRLVVSGDFNSAPWSFERRRQDAAFGLERRTHAIFSWPRVMSRRRIKVPAPFLAIDHIYAGSDWTTVSVERGPALSSDHYPVIAVLALSSSADKPAR